MTLTQNIAPAKFLDKTYDALKLLILSLKLSLKEFIKIPFAKEQTLMLKLFASS